MSTKRIRTKWTLFGRCIEVETDSTAVYLYKRRFPIFGRMKKIASIPTNKIIFWGNNESPAKSSWLYVSEDGTYETLPTSEEQVAVDDKDDWLYSSINSKYRNKELEDNNSSDDLDADVYMNTSTTRLRLKQADLVHLYSFLQSADSVKASVRKANGIIRKQYVAFTPKWLFHIKGKKVDSVPIREMAFFVTNKKYLYCGYHKQINVKINNTGLLKELKELCFSTSKRLSAHGDSYKSGCFFPDNITLTDTAVVYRRKTFGKDEMVYVPYSRINMVCSSNGLLKVRISIYGEQNIVPKHSLWRRKAQKIIDTLKEHGVNVNFGKKICSSKMFPKNWFGMAPCVICMDDCIIYYTNRLRKRSNNLESGMLNYSEITNVIWYKKSFSLFGTLVINGIALNIRKDQISSDVLMIVPELFVWKYKWICFKGKLYRILKKQTSAEFKRERIDYIIPT